MPIFERQSQSGELLISFDAADLVMAGWTGRDEVAVHHHIEELEALGVRPPSKTPFFYRVDPALLVGAIEEIKVVGEATSGEAEAVILAMSDGLWVASAPITPTALSRPIPYSSRSSSAGSPWPARSGAMRK